MWNYLIVIAYIEEVLHQPKNLSYTKITIIIREKLLCKITVDDTQCTSTYISLDRLFCINLMM